MFSTKIENLCFYTFEIVRSFLERVKRSSYLRKYFGQSNLSSYLFYKKQLSWTRRVIPRPRLECLDAESHSTSKHSNLGRRAKYSRPSVMKNNYLGRGELFHVQAFQPWTPSQVFASKHAKKQLSCTRRVIPRPSVPTLDAESSIRVHACTKQLS